MPNPKFLKKVMKEIRDFEQREKEKVERKEVDNTKEKELPKKHGAYLGRHAHSAGEQMGQGFVESITSLFTKFLENLTGPIRDFFKNAFDLVCENFQDILTVLAPQIAAQYCQFKLAYKVVSRAVEYVKHTRFLDRLEADTINNVNYTEQNRFYTFNDRSGFRDDKTNCFLRCILSFFRLPECLVPTGLQDFVHKLGSCVNIYQFFQNLVDCLICVLQSVCSKDNVILRYLMKLRPTTDDPDLDDFYTLVNSQYESGNCDLLLPQMDNFPEMIQRASDIHQSCEKHDKHRRKMAFDVRVKLQTIYSYIVNRQVASARKRPGVAYLFGESSTGKTVVALHLAYKLVLDTLRRRIAQGDASTKGIDLSAFYSEKDGVEWFDENFFERYVYVLRGNEKHWQNFSREHIVLVFDDIWHTSDPKLREAQMQWFHTVTEKGAFFPPQADITSKSIPFCCEYVVVTSNVPYLKSVDRKSTLRRMANHVFIQNKPGIAHSMDFSHVDAKMCSDFMWCTPVIDMEVAVDQFSRFQHAKHYRSVSLSDVYQKMVADHDRYLKDTTYTRNTHDSTPSNPIPDRVFTVNDTTYVKATPAPDYNTIFGGTSVKHAKFPAENGSYEVVFSGVHNDTAYKIVFDHCTLFKCYKVEDGLTYEECTFDEKAYLRCKRDGLKDEQIQFNYHVPEWFPSLHLLKYGPQNTVYSLPAESLDDAWDNLSPAGKTATCLFSTIGNLTVLYLAWKAGQYLFSTFYKMLFGHEMPTKDSAVFRDGEWVNDDDIVLQPLEAEMRETLRASDYSYKHGPLQDRLDAMRASVVRIIVSSNDAQPQAGHGFLIGGKTLVFPKHFIGRSTKGQVVIPVMKNKVLTRYTEEFDLNVPNSILLDKERDVASIKIAGLPERKHYPPASRDECTTFCTISKLADGSICYNGSVEVAPKPQLEKFIIPDKDKKKEPLTVTDSVYRSPHINGFKEGVCGNVLFGLHKDGDWRPFGMYVGGDGKTTCFFATLDGFEYHDKVGMIKHAEATELYPYLPAYMEENEDPSPPASLQDLTDVLDLVTLLPNGMEVTPSADPFEMKNYVHLGKIPINPAMSQRPRTEIRRSPPSIVGLIPEPPYRKPAMLSQQAEQLAMSKKDLPQHPVAMSTKILLEKAKKLVKMHLDMHVNPCKPLSLDEAVLGITHFGEMGPLDMTTSPGYHYKMAGKTKKQLFEVVGQDRFPIYKIDDTVRGRVSDVVKRWRRGEKMTHIFTETLKDELREADRVIKHKTRIFSSGELDHLLAGRIACGDFYKQWMQSGWCHFVGRSPNGLDYHHLITQARKRSTRFGCFDFSSFDATIPNEVMLAVEDIIASYYDDPADALAARVCFAENRASYCHIHGQLYLTDMGNRSGFCFTTMLNTLVNNLIFACAVLSKYPNIDPFELFFYIAYGDDSVYGDSEEYSLTPLEYKDIVFRQFGMIMEPASENKEKLEDVGYVDWTGILFLKRMPLVDHDPEIPPHVIVGVLPKGIIYDMLHYISRKSTPEMYAGNIRAFLDEMGMIDTKEALRVVRGLVGCKFSNEALLNVNVGETIIGMRNRFRNVSIDYVYNKHVLSPYAKRQFTLSVDKKDVTFNCINQAYQYLKAIVCHRTLKAQEVLDEINPHRQTAIQLHNSDSEHWLKKRFTHMYHILDNVYGQCADFRNALQTDVQYEHAVSNTYWGVPGKNCYGQCLMTLAIDKSL